VDVNPGVHKLAQKRIQTATIAVNHQILSGEHLPMADETFDGVVSTFTLCSIANVEQATQEIHRVLKPGGRFFFVEHGLSNDPEIQVWQHRLTPVQKVIAAGCHLDRQIQQLVENHFDTLTIEAEYAEKLPKVMAYFYRGVATKSNSDNR
jgi:ubiquinone/menaquinone biosynthesis C-methylase UbiE